MSFLFCWLGLLFLFPLVLLRHDWNIYKGGAPEGKWLETPGKQLLCGSSNGILSSIDVWSNEHCCHNVVAIIVHSEY